MRLLSASPPDNGDAHMRVSVEVAEGVRLHDVKITRAGRVFARNASFDRAIVDQIFNLVKGASQHDRSK